MIIINTTTVIFDTNDEAESIEKYAETHPDYEKKCEDGKTVFIHSIKSE